MKTEVQEVVNRNTIFGWIALATGLLLLIPLLAMQLTSEVRWDVFDFTIMGFLIFTSCSLAVLVLRRTPRTHWALVGFLFAVTFFYVWAELAVGIFTDLGS